MRVFPDTGALLAMIVFPRDRSGALTLAGEVLELYEAGAFDLVTGQAVVDELDEVLDEQFPWHRLRAVSLLTSVADHLVRRPTPAEIAAVLSFYSAPSDAPIFPSALIAKPDVVLFNDFRLSTLLKQNHSGSNTALRWRASTGCCTSLGGGSERAGASSLAG